MFNRALDWENDVFISLCDNAGLIAGIVYTKVWCLSPITLLAVLRYICYYVNTEMMTIIHCASIAHAVSIPDSAGKLKGATQLSQQYQLTDSKQGEDLPVA